MKKHIPNYTPKKRQYGDIFKDVDPTQSTYENRKRRALRNLWLNLSECENYKIRTV